MALNNQIMNNYDFLRGMYNDGYFPDFLVDKIKKILIDLCEKIEQQNPPDNDSLLVLTHAATELINKLDEEFGENDSELETVAREVIAENFETIVKAYGFDAVDIEDVIASREW